MESVCPSSSARRLGLLCIGAMTSASITRLPSGLSVDLLKSKYVSALSVTCFFAGGGGGAGGCSARRSAHAIVTFHVGVDQPTGCSCADGGTDQAATKGAVAPLTLFHR